MRCVLQDDLTENLTEFLCSTIALASERDPSDLLPSTTLLELNLDSLTFVSVLAQLEAVYDVDLHPDDVLALLDAKDIAELARSISCLGDDSSS